MKIMRIVPVLIAILAVSAVVVLNRRSDPEPVPQPEARPLVDKEPVLVQQDVFPTVRESNEIVRVEKQPLHTVQPLEERGDAMLFEIDALQNTPFDQSVTMPLE